MSFSIQAHYQVGGILDSILSALADMGKNPDELVPADLAPVDEFHIRGRQATLELVARGALQAGERVLDLGCGIGGSARHLAHEHGCEVTGVDLTQEYVDVARALSQRVGLGDRVTFRQGSALALPFEDAGFDAVWTEHVQMNIADKATFYREAHRVLKPGGALLFHDIFRGAGQDPLYPVPWAEEASISHLWTPDRVRATLDEVGFEVRDWEDVSRPSLEWFLDMLAQRAEGGAPPLGIHLLMGATAPAKLKNLVENLKGERIAVAQCVAVRRA